MNDLDKILYWAGRFEHGPQAQKLLADLMGICVRLSLAFSTQDANLIDGRLGDLGSFVKNLQEKSRFMTFSETIEEGTHQ